jgi:segregation and condensation protein A
MPRPPKLENDVFQPRFDFDPGQEDQDEIAPDETLNLDLDGYEGPLHVLLALARTQKVDLLKISITRLVEQYLHFVHEAKRLRFSLAADYLVMASWLAYLKSRLLLPRPKHKGKDEDAPEVLAQALGFRLQKLEAMRKAALALSERPQLKRDVFIRGDPQSLTIVPSTRLELNLFELMAAYTVQRRREIERHYDPTRRIEAYPLEAAREHLRASLPHIRDWTPLEDLAPTPVSASGPRRASYLASTLSASLELTKEGQLQIQQLGMFEALYMRSREVPKYGL